MPKLKLTWGGLRDTCRKYRSRRWRRGSANASCAPAASAPRLAAIFAEESSLLSGLRDDPAALAKLLAQPDLAVSEADVLYALDHGGSHAVEDRLLRKMRARGDAVGTMEPQVHARAASTRRQSTEIINLIASARTRRRRR